MEIRERIGKNVRRLIYSKGVTLRGFAKAHGFSYGFISRVVSGEANVTILKLQKLARALNTSIAKLVE